MQELFASLAGDGTWDERAARIVVPLIAIFLIISIAVAQAMSVAAILLAAYVVVRRKSFRRTPLDIPLAAFLLARICSVALSVDPRTSAVILSTEIPFFLLFYAVVQITDGDETLTVRVIRGMVYAGAVGSLYGVVKVLLGVDGRASSLSAGYFTLGTYIVSMLAIVAFTRRDRKLWPNTAVWALLAFILLTGLAFTLNRTHWAIAALVILAAGILRERMVLLIAAVGAACVILFVPSVRMRIYEMIHFQSFLSDRDVLWRGAMVLAKEHPLTGFGPNTFHAIFPFVNDLADKKVGGWHNDFLRVYLESGIIGLGAFVWWLGTIFASVVDSLRRGRMKGERRDQVIAFGMLMGGLALSSLGGSGLLDITIIMLHSVVLALLVRMLTAKPANQRSS